MTSSARGLRGPACIFIRPNGHMIGENQCRRTMSNQRAQQTHLKAGQPIPIASGTVTRLSTADSNPANPETRAADQKAARVSEKNLLLRFSP